MATIERGPSPFDGLEPAEVSAWLANPVTERLRKLLKLRHEDTKAQALTMVENNGPHVPPERLATSAAWLSVGARMQDDFQEAERYARGQ